MKPRNLRQLLLLTVLTTPLYAQSTVTWDQPNANNNWNTTDANWTGGATFANGDFAAFSSATGETVTVTGGGVLPGSTTISGNGSWTFSGGSIGSGTLTKGGAGTLALTSSNGFSSASVSAGTIRMQNATSLGAGTVTHSGGGQLQFSFGNGSTTTVANNIVLDNTASTNRQTFIIRGTDGAAISSATTVRLTGVLSGGSATTTHRIADSNQGSNHNNVLILDNASNSFQGTIEMWRGTLAITSNAALGNAENDIRHETENNSGALRFDAANIVLPATRSINFPGGKNARPINTQTFTSTIAGVISGAGTLVKQGSGTLILTNSNTYTGDTTLTAGTVRINQATGLGTGAVNHTGGSLRFSFGDGTTTVFPNNISLNSTGNTTLVIRGTNDAGPTTATTVRLTGILSGGAAGQAYTIADSGVSGNHNNVLVLENASNSFTGQIVMDRGTLAIASNAVLGNANNGIRINTWNLNGALRFDADNIILPSTRAIALADGSNLSPINTQAFNATIAGVFSGTGTLVKQGSGTLVLTGASTSTGAINVSAGTLEIGGAGRLGAASHNGALTIGGTLRFNSSASQTLGGTITGAGSLVKNGSGVLTLSGSASGFTGTTAVDGGTLLLNNAAASNISVASGATFGGSGSTTGSLTLASGSTFAVSSGTFLAPGGVTIGGPVNVVFASAPAPGTYPILEYGNGGLTGSVANLTSTSGRASFSDDPQIKSIVLNVTTGTRTWATTDGTWDLGISENFFEDDKKFFAGDSVVFPTRPAASVVTLNGPLVPEEVTAEHDSDYQLTGTGFLSGDMNFIKHGTGTMTIGTPNTYTGFTTVGAGTLTAASATAFGTGTVFMDGGVLNLGNQTIGNAISFLGGSLAGPGIASGVLSNNLVVSSGVVSVTGSMSIGTASITGSATLSIGNGGTLGTLGAVPVSIEAGSILQVNRSNAFTLANNLSGDGALRQSGTATLTITGTNTHTGGTTLASSQLNVPNPAALGSGAVTILPAANSGTGGGVATLYFNNTAAVSVGNAIVLPSPGVATTYTIMKQTSGQLTGQLLDLTGVISGGNSNSVLRLNSNTGGDTTTTYRLAGINTFSGDLELYRGAIIITNNQSLGNARLLLNGNNNGTAGDVRFENSVTLANDVVLFNTSNVDPFHTGGNTVTLTGTVSGIPGGFGLSKIGAGTLILSGPTTYAADTAINGGTLALAGNATLASSPNIILGSGAIFDISAIETTYALAFAQTLRGVGTVEGAFTANGTISPGAAVNTLGTLTFNDGLVMGTAVNLLQIDTSTGQSDRLIITGDVVANNATALTVTDIATVPAALPAGTKIALMQYTGTFTGLLDINAELDVADGASITIGANTFVVDYDDTTDGVNPGKYLTLTVPGAPPSPYTTWAAANGLDGTPGKESGKFVDPDNDGKVNFVEFFLGGTPLDGALGGLSAPVVTDRLILTFAAPAGTLFTNGVAVVDGVTCTVQGSSNLQNFTAPVTKLASPVLTGLDWPVVAPAGYEYFSFQLDDSVSLDEGGFMRLHFAE